MTLPDRPVFLQPRWYSKCFLNFQPTNFKVLPNQLKHMIAVKAVQVEMTKDVFTEYIEQFI